MRNATLPAGNYQLTYSSNAQRLTILALYGKPASTITTAIPTVASGSSNKTGKLVFDCYGKACYLAEVWQGSVGGNRGLQVRETERPRGLSMSARIVSVTIPTR